MKEQEEEKEKKQKETQNKERLNNAKHFTESQRLREVFKLNSTLEEQPICEEIEDDE